MDETQRVKRCTPPRLSADNVTPWPFIGPPSIAGRALFYRLRRFALSYFSSNDLQPANPVTLYRRTSYRGALPTLLFDPIV